MVFQVICFRKKKLVYTGIRLRPEEFDTDNERIIKIKRPARDIKRMNNYLEEEHARLTRLFGQVKTAEDFKDIARQASLTDNDAPASATHHHFGLLTYFDYQVSKKSDEGRSGLAAAYRSTRNSLARFLENKNLKIELVTERLVLDYRRFLERRGVCENTVCYYIRNFKSVYHYALDDGARATPKDPFGQVPTSPRSTEKRALKRSQMQAIKELDLNAFPTLKFYRDLYLFSFYAQGMSFVDISFLRKENLTANSINYLRHKSGQPVRIPLIPQLKEIIVRYASPDRDFIFPLLTTNSDKSMYTQYRNKLRIFNYNLERIVEKLKFSIALTTYTSRHTWATLAHDCGIPLAVISAGLGHTSEQTTAIYLKELDMEELKKACTKVAGMI